MIRCFQCDSEFYEKNNVNEDHGKLSSATLFVSLFVLFVPTFNVFESTLVGVCAHSITLFMRLFLSLCESLWTHSHFCSLHFVYVRVCLCVQFRCLCKLHFCPAVSFCPLYAFLPLCVFLSSSFCQRCLCQIRSVCVHSACIVRAHSRCLCLLSSVFAPTLLLPALCTLSVFVHSVSHHDL